MTITRQNAERLSLTEMQESVAGGWAVPWSASGREAIYEFLRRVLETQEYPRLSKGQKGIVRHPQANRREMADPLPGPPVGRFVG